ncbi:hypothetical protein MPSEU_000231200 [Mayamaea pseudoterrestris]|nr:hypothetical protein MPSEU_000231200 [Mayamaea pseudoterrestris]
MTSSEPHTDKRKRMTTEAANDESENSETLKKRLQTSGLGCGSPDQTQETLALAPSLVEFMVPGGTLMYRPRPEWVDHHVEFHVKIKFSNTDSNETQMNGSATTVGGLESEMEEPRAAEKIKPRNPFNPTELFEEFLFPPLLVATATQNVDAVIALLNAGAHVECSDETLGQTPLLLAASLGNKSIMKILLESGASMTTSNYEGFTALHVAAAGAHIKVLEFILPYFADVDVFSQDKFTPLMVAASEGHFDVCKRLIDCGATINAHSRMGTTPLMLAAIEGHNNVCQLFLECGADVNARTNRNKTSLMLAAKSGHLSSVQLLLSAGCELYTEDKRGRTAKMMASDQQIKELIDSNMQVRLMQEQVRRERTRSMGALWKLLQDQRAYVSANNVLREDGEDEDEDEVRVFIHSAQTMLKNPPLSLLAPSTQALVRVMALPDTLAAHVCGFLPFPYLWRRRLDMLTRQESVESHATIVGALDLIDETLEEGGLVEAFGQAGVPPPDGYSSWHEWKTFLRLNGGVAADLEAPPDQEPSITTAKISDSMDSKFPTLVGLRRQCGYLSLLANPSYCTSISKVLTGAPYNLPLTNLQELAALHDLASLSRRMGTRNGVTFDTPVARDVLAVARRLCEWYWQHRDG